MREGMEGEIKEKDEFEITSLGKKEKERQKENCFQTNRQRFTLDVVLVFCCFERDSRGSNLVSVWLNQALWQHGTQCLFWSTWQPEAPLFISLSHCLSVSCHIFVGLKVIFPLLLSPVVSVWPHILLSIFRTEENAFVSVSLDPSPFPSFESTEMSLM